MKPEFIEIDKLLLDGLELADPAALARSLTAELSRLSSSGDWPQPGDASPIQWQPSDGAESLSRAVAQRIVHAISQPQSSR